MGAFCSQYFAHHIVLINLGGSKVDAWTYTYLNWAYVMVACHLF